MDWISQNKYKNLLIAVLLVLNLITVSIIWMQIANRNEPGQTEQTNRGSESLQVMKTVLDLTDVQIAQYEQIRTAQREQSKEYNNRLTTLKIEFAESIFSATQDSTMAVASAQKIGEVQSKIELIRYNNFKALAAACTPEQRMKLKPIIIEVFGRKPPKEESDGTKQRIGGNSRPGTPRGDESGMQQGSRRGDGAESPQQGTPRGDESRMQQGSQRGDRPNAPPPLQELLTKYSERLTLSTVQVAQVKTVLLNARSKDEQLRMRKNPEPGAIDKEKEKNRTEEEAGIMKILTEEQRREFITMRKRKK